MSDTTERLEIDFDHHSEEFAHAHRATWSDIIERCPVAWSDAYGGFWVVSNYEHVAAVSRDDETFSSRHELDEGSPLRGIAIPEAPVVSVPIELDPPEFFPFRKLLTPFFAPAAIERLRPRIQEITDALLDKWIESGQADLVEEFTAPVPALVTMDFLGLPIDKWEDFARPVHAFVSTPAYSADRPRVAAGFLGIRDLIAEVVRDRRSEPRDDFITQLIDATMEGEPLDDETIVKICGVVTSGGVGTTMAGTAQSLAYLGRNSKARELLIADPSKLPAAIEEFLRYYSPVQTLARTATKDVRLGDQEIHAGDRVLVGWAGANQDPAEFDDPQTVDMGRTSNRHVAFGLGIHRCIGSHLARMEMSVMIQTVLRRIPDYVIDEAGVVQFPSLGQNNGLLHLPVTFTPGPRLGRSTV